MEISQNPDSKDIMLMIREGANSLCFWISKRDLEVRENNASLAIKGFSYNAYVQVDIFEGVLIVLGTGFRSTIRKEGISVTDVKEKLKNLGCSINGMPSDSELAKWGV